MEKDCPFCPARLPNEEEWNNHILVAHPEKTQSAEAYGQAMAKVMAAITGKQEAMRLAANLTYTTIGTQGADEEKVWAVFCSFLDRLTHSDQPEK